MSDARELLTGTSSNSGSASSFEQQLQKATNKRKSGSRRPTGGAKAAGMHRELFALLPDGITSIAPAPAAVFKEKPKLGKAKAANWAWRPFKSSARSDSLELSHWVRAEDAAADYPYSKFNKHLKVVKYTADEYQLYFEDAEWTKEDTDNLFELCERFDLRFPVIADRLEGGKSIEDAKARYYSITRKLIELRNDVTDPAVQAEMAKYVYDKEREIERKAQLDRLLRRTPEQVKEEQYLLVEARKLEANAKRLVKERQHVVQLLSAIDTAFNPPRPGGGGRGGSAADALVTKMIAQRGGSSAGDVGFGLDGGASSMNQMPRRKEKLPTGAFVRSSRLVMPISTTTKMGKRLDQQLTDLGLPLRPSVPTQQVCDLFEDLRQEIITLLDLKKQVDRREYDIAVLKSRRESILTGREMAAPPPPPESADDTDEAAGPNIRKRLSTSEYRDSPDKRARHQL